MTTAGALPDPGHDHHPHQLGPRWQVLDGAGAIQNYSYDALDRVITTTYPGDAAANVSYTYDESGYGFGVGRLTTVTDAAGKLNRSYDERGNVLSETRSFGEVAYSTPRATTGWHCISDPSNASCVS